MADDPLYVQCYCAIDHVKSNESLNIDLVNINVPFDDEKLLKEWAVNFRRKFISDDDLIEELEDTGINEPLDYLLSRIYPTLGDNFANSVRIGDFGEVLVAEYLMFLEQYWVPTLFTRYYGKPNKDKSTMGSDIFAIKFADDSGENPNDELCICEVKTGFSGTAKSRLQNAIDGSNKDDLSQIDLRVSASLGASKLGLKHNQNGSPFNYKKIARFENPIERPYNNQYLAAAVVDDTILKFNKLKEVTVGFSKHKKNLRMITFHGIDLRKLLNALYGELGGEQS
ncbi:hypothetical protein ACFQ4L_01570 [Lapidilactobacillus mulanensis]|uniref:Anti-bacteriophage protein A/HamA C-terminal domain-containing protein n=2 Tax=Lactobacillaceae TaxID=33958 RepID=A0ABW4DJD1_9LACO|nr:MULTISPECIES: hypothetical protein [Lactobacillaceae]